MAALALAAVLAKVHIVLRMTGQARRVELHPVWGLDVATGALQFAVGAAENEAGLLGMIEFPKSPAVR